MADHSLTQKHDAAIDRSLASEVPFNLGQYLLPVFCLLTLTGCGKTLNSEAIAQTIQQDVIKQGGVSLKTVTCPNSIKPEAGRSFECVGEIDSGYTFTIPVKQQDDKGTVIWDIPNAKGLINLVKLETLVQDGVTGEIGSRPIIRCGGTYKAVRPGQTFECQLEAKAVKPKGIKTVALKPSKPDKIVVAVDTESNVNWQRVVPSVATKPASKASRSNSKASQPNASPAKALPGKKSAEDFLNTSGASDSFED